MVKLRGENSKIKIAVLKTVSKLLESLKENYIVLIQDILPFIADTLDDENNEVSFFSIYIYNFYKIFITVYLS